jgi:hypothetical protein
MRRQRVWRGPDARRGGPVDYVRIYAGDDGVSHFEDVDAEVSAQVVADGVPPLLVTGPFPVSALQFVEQRPGGPDWEPHVAPRRQWVICVRGRAEITVSDGERRRFEPGASILVEDVTGEGHVSTPLTDDLAFVMLPVAM